METLMIAILFTLMLVIIAAGSVAYCVSVGKKASRAIHKTEALYEERVSLFERMEQLEDKYAILLDKSLQSAPQSATRDVDRANEQFDRLQAFQPKNYGLNFEGVAHDED